MTSPDLSDIFRQHGWSAFPVDRVNPARVPEKPLNCGAVRVVLAGSRLMSLVNHPSVVPLERVFRRIPLAGAFTATPSNPFSFELGAVEVPAQMALVLLDYRFAIYVPDGLVPGNTEELEDRELSTSIGYDLRFNDRRPDNVRYDLTPSPPTVTATETFKPFNNPGVIPGEGLSQVSESTFQQLRASNTRSSVSSGSATLPQRHRRDAQLAMPFTYIVQSNQRVNMRVNIFEAVPMPIAFFEGELSGMFMPMMGLHAFLKEVPPCID